MSVETISSIPSSVPSLNPITPVPPVKVQDNANDNQAEKVRSKPPAGVGETVDVEA